MSDQNFNLGRHEALIEQLVKGQDTLIERVTAIEQILAEKRAERRMVVWAGGSVAGALGALCIWILKTAFAAVVHK